MLTVPQCRRALDHILKDGDYFKALLEITPREKWGEIVREPVQNKYDYSSVFYSLLQADQYELAVSLVLPRHRFSLRARSARKIWNLCMQERLLLIMGSAAVGKSFVIAHYCLLDFMRDPMNTFIQVVSVTKKHAKSNLFGQICKAWNAIGKIVHTHGVATAEKLSATPGEDMAGIFLVGIPDGDQGIGSLRGLHPKPREVIHPKFGALSRNRVILDEAGEIPRGIWSDLGNAFSTVDGTDCETIKILGASNPEDPNTDYGQRCEPRGGWVTHDDNLEEWTSSRGWKVYRIDAAKTENVVERKVVEGCEGMQTYDGYMLMLEDSGGEGTSRYYVMCRGMFPPQGSSHSIVSNLLLQGARGEWIFENVPQEIYSLDTALDGGDHAVLTFAKFGMARRGIFNGEEKLVHDVARQVIQIDFQIELQPGNSLKVAEHAIEQIPKNANGFYIAVDGTGSGDGCASILARKFNDEIYNIIYSERPTETKIMFDDIRLASQVYKNLRAEMWYSMRRWLESKLILFSNNCQVDLFRELSGVQGGRIGGKWVVEKKEKYKNRNRGKSPDHAESAIQTVQLVRVRGEVDAGIFEDSTSDGVTQKAEVDFTSALGGSYETWDN